MTSAENSNFENFLGKENPRHPPPPNKARAFGTRDNAPRYKKPSYSPWVMLKKSCVTFKYHSNPGKEKDT